jgi:arylsulfatase A-like enzyme
VHGIGSLMDVYATALSLAGVTDVADDVDSIDLSPAFKGKASPRGALEYFSKTGQLLGYRKGAWKVSFTENGITRSDKVSLYNLQEDPAESTDLSKQNPNMVKNLLGEAQQRNSRIPRAAPIFDQD